MFLRGPELGSDWLVARLYGKWFPAWPGDACRARRSPDLSAAFHTYGLAWRDDHKGKQGSLEGYIDGTPIVDHPVPINGPSWGSGAYCYAGWMQQEQGDWGGSAKIDSRTSSKDPLHIKRFTVWKAN